MRESRPPAPAEEPPQTEEQVDEMVVETFPASDAPGWSPTRVGGPRRRAEAPPGELAEERRPGDQREDRRG